MLFGYVDEKVGKPRLEISTGNDTIYIGLASAQELVANFNRGRYRFFAAERPDIERVTVEDLAKSY